MHGRRGRTWRLAGTAAVCFIVAATFHVTAAESEADRRLREQITSRLEGQVSLHPRNLVVEVNAGAVRLSGSVASLEEVDAIGRLVRGIVEVRDLDNRVTVRPSSRSDLAIRQELRQRLDQYPALRLPAVDTAVKEGRVILSGQVPDGVDRVEAERQARGVAGVVSVDNRIGISGNEATAGSSVSQSPSGDGLAVRVRSLLANPLTFGAVRQLRVEAEASTVYLYGKAIREADRAQAEKLALTVDGVKRVVNLITVDPT